MQESLELWSFETHEFDTFFIDIAFFILFENDFNIELFIGDRGSGELYVSDFVNFEVDDRLHDEDEWLFEHEKPTGLCLDVTLDTWLSVSGLVVVTRVDDVDLAAGLDQIDEHLEQVSVVLLFELFQMGELFGYFGVEFGFDLDFEVFLHLDDDVVVDGEALVEGFVFVELEHDGHLALVGHWQNEPFVDVFVVDVVAVGGAVQSEVLLVKVDCVFASWDCEVHVDQSGDWVACELSDFGFLCDCLIKWLCVGLFLFLFLFIFLPLLFLVFHTVLVFWLVDEKTNFAHTVFITDLLDWCLDYDIIFIDCNIFHIIEEDTEHFLVAHAEEL